jgi:hypothetical protein
MQKWVNISVVMNSKTLDIYLDGKLVKTCVYTNYFKVDQTGVALRYLQGNTVDSNGRHMTGFDGYFSRLQVFNSALNPDDIYKTYNDMFRRVYAKYELIPDKTQKNLVAQILVIGLLIKKFYIEINGKIELIPEEKIDKLKKEYY